MSAHPNSRRRFLRSTVSASVLSVAAVAGLLKPTASHAQFPFFNFKPSKRPTTPAPAVSPPAPTARVKTPLETLVNELRNARPEITTSVDIMSPEIAVDGASIMLDFQALLPDVDGFAVYIEGNPQPLAAVFYITSNVLPEIKLLVRLAQSSAVTVVARSQGRYYRNSKFIKVTHGGCRDSFEETESTHRREVQRLYRSAP
jgi:predicted secreted protein